MLDLLVPLFAAGKESSLSVEGVRGVQTKLHEAIADNKVSLQVMVLAHGRCASDCPILSEQLGRPS